jgi:phosphoglycolate phosphatase
LTIVHHPSSISLILFDIDGTLIHLHGAGRRAFGRSFEHVFGAPDDLAGIHFGGATDRGVLREVLARRDRSATAEEINRFLARLPVELAQTLREPAEAGHTLYPGVRELLDRLSATPHIRLGLVTGNVQACARLKLEHFGLWHYFSFGGFGDDHEDRAGIARQAMHRATARLPVGARYQAVYLVGDSPSDVAAARAISAVSVAVATGVFDCASLEAAAPDHLLDNLADLERCLHLFHPSP